jgi:hypothetical protein
MITTPNNTADTKATVIALVVEKQKEESIVRQQSKSEKPK